MKPKIKQFNWLLYILWALFVNVLNAWIVIPLVEDYALLGVFAVIGIVFVWLTSIPGGTARKRWISFTLFSLLLAQGFSWLTFYPLLRRTVFGTIIFIGLFVIAWLFAKIKAQILLVSGVVLIGVNILLPISEWPFLTHFRVAHYGSYNIVPGDIPALPFAQIDTNHGTAFITLKRTEPSKAELATLAKNATSSPTALGDILSTRKDEYRLVELSSIGGRVQVSNPTSDDIAKINPFDLIGPSFPFSLARWVRVNNEVIQYMTPALPVQTATGLGMESALYPTNMVLLSQTVHQAQLKIWNEFLGQLGVNAVSPNLQVENGFLVGTYHGHAVKAAVKGSAFISEGSFTEQSAPEALVQGANILEVVDLNSNAVVETYHAGENEFVPGDMVVGPLTSNGKDAVFVNDSPAYILQSSSNGHFEKVYTAPNQSLRFEASVQFPGDKSPEIITDDPSVIRNSPIRYFTSYSYQNGNLARNWRVYRQNVVNVQPIAFRKGSQPDLVVGIYGTGEYLVLQRAKWPVLTIAYVILGIVILFGWMIRFGERRRRNVG